MFTSYVARWEQSLPDSQLTMIQGYDVGGVNTPYSPCILSFVQDGFNFISSRSIRQSANDELQPLIRTESGCHLGGVEPFMPLLNDNNTDKLRPGWA